MAQYNPEMYNYAPERSPGSTRGGGSLYRAPSRHFDSSYSTLPQGLYTAEDHAQRYEPTPRFDTHRMAPAATLHSYNQYDTQTWNYGGTTGGSLMGGTGRIKPSARRPVLPNVSLRCPQSSGCNLTDMTQGWLDQQQMPPPQHIPSYQMNGHYTSQAFQQNSSRAPQTDPADELIPTALVIKNIPFAVKKEMILQLMTDMNLPLPYAFNYHFDQGVFRGLAFANFSSSEETKIVIEQMNHLELAGRKLRVEYKKMLPIEERERIERDKREKRGQLEEQHRPIAPGTLHNQASITSLNSGPVPISPSPISIREKGYYTELMLFKGDANRETLIFPPTVPAADRRIIHILAHNMGLEHRSEGQGETRCVQILKQRPAPHISPPLPTTSYYNDNRRGLNRAATIDFSETREQNNYHNHTLGRQGSGLLDIPGSPGLGGLSAAHNLRAAKSFADLRSYTPSPVPSTASFPVGLSQNISRYTDYGHSSAASGTPNLTPTSAGGLNSRDDTFILNGLGTLNLGFDRSNGNRTNANGRIGQERENHTSNTGPIGSQRPLNGTKQDNLPPHGSTVAERQPRGPGSDWGAGSGFSRPRQNGHANNGSGELDLNSYDNGWDDNRTQDSSDRNGSLVSKPNRYK